MKLLLIALAMILICPQAHGVLVFEYPPDPEGGIGHSSWFPPEGSDNDIYSYEKFLLDTSVPITEVRWRGGYSPAGYGQLTDFSVMFCASNAPNGFYPDCGIPGEFEVYLARYQVGGLAGQTPAGTFGGVTMYDYHFTLPEPFQATAGVTYWIRIEGETDGQPFWGVAGGTGGNGSHIEYSTGTAMFSNWPHDLAFSLHTTAGAPVYTVTTDVSPVGAGTTTGDGDYPEDSQALVEATSNTGWIFVNWTENGVPVSALPSYAFTVNADRDLVANFISAYTITTTVSPPLSGTAVGGGAFIGGTEVTVVATANPGYVFSNWAEFGSPVSALPVYTFLVDADRDLVANFNLISGSVFFDLDNGPVDASLPVDLAVDGLGAHFWATGPSNYRVLPATDGDFPLEGFYGLCIFPDTDTESDLEIDFDQPLGFFSIMYAPNEVGCDDTATMRLTAFLDGVYVGTSTSMAAAPGDWPTGILSFSSDQAFDQVVIHYDSPPPTCQDWAPAFAVDNMLVTLAPGTAAVDDPEFGLRLAPTVAPNPFTGRTTVNFSTARSGPVTVTVHDLRGRLVRTLMNGAPLGRGAQVLGWDGRDSNGHRAANGVYLCRIIADGQVQLARMSLLRGE